MEHLRLFQFLTWKSPVRPSCYRKLRASTLTVPPNKTTTVLPSMPHKSPPIRVDGSPDPLRTQGPSYSATEFAAPAHARHNEVQVPLLLAAEFCETWKLEHFGLRKESAPGLQAPTLPISSPESQKPLEMLTLSLRALSRCSRDTLTVRPGLGSETRQATQVGAQGVRELPNDCRHRRCDTGSSCLRKGICSRRVGGA